MPFTLDAAVGRRDAVLDPPFPKRIEGSALVLDTPVGVQQDVRGNVWVADTGNNRLLVLDAALENVLMQIGTAGTAPGEFDLPFRIAHHPDERALFVTDLGNHRVQRLAYDYDGEVPVLADAAVFAADPDGPPAGPDEARFHPNGVAVHDYDDVGLRVFVADEFYHDDPADLRSRILGFDADGTLCEEFRTVDCRSAVGADRIPLYWPQGIDVDSEGRLLIANTGYGVLRRVGEFPSYFANVLRCDRTGRGVPFPSTGSPVLDDEFVTPRGVSVVETGGTERVLVPDVGGGFVYVYDYNRQRSAEIPSLIAPDLAERRFGSPMQVSAYDGPFDDPDSTAARVLLTEALSHAVSVYDLDTISERQERLATARSERAGRDQLDFVAGAVGVGGPAGAGRLVLADGDNGRLQVCGPDGGLSPAALPANRFPVGTAYWPTSADAGYLFVGDYSLWYRSHEDEPQIAAYQVDSGADGPTFDHVDSFGDWGVYGASVKLPRGMDVQPIDDARARLLVADSLNGQLAEWTFDRATETIGFEGNLGRYGHDVGEFWNPSDVAVGREAVYVADRNNNRLQVLDAGRWHAVGEAGYGTGGDRFLLPQSVAAVDGYVFAVDLVNRSVVVFAEGRADGRPTLTEVDSLSAFGGRTARGDLWMPYMLQVIPRSDYYEVAIPDAVLNVAYRYRWTPPA